MSSIADDVADTLSTVNRPAEFCVAGRDEMLAPGLTVSGVGPVALPLLPIQAEQIIAAAERAPFGRGEATLTDLAVRRTWQIAAERIGFTGKHWPATLGRIVARIAESLGIDGEVKADIYKLLIYDTGSFFVPHRDTEKAPGMFATLVIALPSVAEGGELIVSHMGREKRIDLRCTDPSELTFAAFYADCVHEVLPVTAGYRLVLVYNLLRRGRKPLPKPADYGPQQSSLASVLSQWRTAAPGEATDEPLKLIYTLSHAYTEAELGFAALKGADAALADLVVAAAASAGCEVHLALISIEENCAAEYSGRPSRSRRGGYDSDGDGYEAGEVYERRATAAHWRRADGTAAALGEIPIFEEEFSPPVEFDTLEPDEQHFHEATGNAGATLERLYRRAALILWPQAGSLAVINQGGLQAALPYLGDLAARWQARGDASAREQAHVLSGHMIASWPTHQGLPGSQKGQSSAGRFLDTLARLGDDDRIDAFLVVLAGRTGFDAGDAKAIAAGLSRLAPARGADLATALVRGAAARAFGACAKLLALLSVDHADLAVAAARALAAALPGDASDAAMAGWQRRPAVLPDHLADLITALARVDKALAVSAAATICARPAIYDSDEVLVPATIVLVGTPDIAGDAGVAMLRAACLRHLDDRIAQPLDPPADWRRDSRLGCACRDCQALAGFLADPGEKLWVFAAAEARRNHVEATIRSARCDVATTTERRGSPHKLVCTKTQASYLRRCRQREQDLAAVGKLRAAM